MQREEYPLKELREFLVEFYYIKHIRCESTEMQKEVEELKMIIYLRELLVRHMIDKDLQVEPLTEEELRSKIPLVDSRGMLIESAEGINFLLQKTHLEQPTMDEMSSELDAEISILRDQMIIAEEAEDIEHWRRLRDNLHELLSKRDDLERGGTQGYLLENAQKDRCISEPQQGDKFIMRAGYLSKIVTVLEPRQEESQEEQNGRQ